MVVGTTAAGVNGRPAIAATRLMISATIWIVKIAKPISITARNGHTTGFHPPEPVRSPVRMPSSRCLRAPRK